MVTRYLQSTFFSFNSHEKFPSNGLGYQTPWLKMERFSSGLRQEPSYRYGFPLFCIDFPKFRTYFTRSPGIISVTTSFTVDSLILTLDTTRIITRTGRFWQWWYYHTVREFKETGLSGSFLFIYNQCSFSEAW